MEVHYLKDLTAHVKCFNTNLWQTVVKLRIHILTLRAATKMKEKGDQEEEEKSIQF